MTSAWFEELRARLADRPPRSLGPLPHGVREASVLVPFFLKEGAPHLLFIKRPDGNYKHAGQIAFPGGKRDPSDESALAAALREAEEEMRIRPADVDVLGQLDEYDTVVSGFRVTPVVGVIPYPYAFEPDPREVERWLEVPVATLLAPDNFREEERDTAWGRRVIFYYSAGGGDVIWGVTAAILLPLLTLVRERG